MSSEGEPEVFSFFSLHAASCSEPVCRHCWGFIRAGNRAQGLDVKAFALFMCGI